MKIIHNDLYNFYIHVTIGYPEKYKKKYSLQFTPEDLNGFAALFYTLKNPTHYCITVLEPISIGALTHECLHLTNQVLKDRGALESNNDEPQCYLLQWVVNKVLKSIPTDYIK
jgi:hypothetical protein